MRLADINALHQPRPRRAERLAAAIKHETLWLLIARPAAPPSEISEDFAAADRRQFIKLWPAIRHQRLEPNALENFYALVADQASAFAHLIEIRRTRERNRSARQ